MFQARYPYHRYATVCTNCDIGDRCKPMDVTANFTRGRYPAECAQICNDMFSSTCSAATFELNNPVEQRCTLYECGDLDIGVLPASGKSVYSLLDYDEWGGSPSQRKIVKTILFYRIMCIRTWFKTYAWYFAILIVI